MTRAGVAALLVVVAGCSAAVPPGAAERALYSDLRQIADHRDRSGQWLVDRHAVEQATDVTLVSVCQTPEASRERLAAWLDAQVAAHGGAARAQYARNGHDLGALSAVVTWERVRMLLDHGVAHAADCPFWLDADPAFEGVQTNARGGGMLLESIGSGAILVQGGKVALGGFGGARMLPYLAVSPHVLLALGVEVGGAGTLEQTDTGERQLSARFSFGVPLLVRLRDGTRFVDLEIAGTNRFTESEFPVAPGVRASLAVGFSTLRSRGFLPHASLWLGYELTPGHDGAADEHAIRFGTRVGVDWDP